MWTLYASNAARRLRRAPDSYDNLDWPRLVFRSHYYLCSALLQHICCHIDGTCWGARICRWATSSVVILYRVELNGLGTALFTPTFLFFPLFLLQTTHSIQESMKALLILAIVAIASAAPFLSQSEVDRINSIPGLTWKASTKQGSRINGASLESIKALMGVQRHIKKELPRRVFTAAERADPIPESFDSAEKWPDCKTIPQIRDQSACGSCWAIAAAEAMSDRYCIAGIDKDLEISTANLMECCWFCGQGCNGGNPGSAWNYWVQTGLFDEVCQPYPFPKCAHHIAPVHYPACPKTYPTPSCKASACTNSTGKPTKHKGAKSYSLEGEEDFQRELMAHGPFEVAFDVYEDWVSYKSGVYTQTSDKYLGGHAVKLVGWGVLDGTKYWKIANSWNEEWGAEGYFLIKRGEDECGVESEGTAGTPKA